ncbi:hypothetical protein SVAN01_07892 [Stagonosporopsis vannaccii]|nr:hypothetical protein SVAN01_07892 [Stagonosporopsis vannaccii]
MIPRRFSSAVISSAQSSSRGLDLTIAASPKDAVPNRVAERVLPFKPISSEPSSTKPLPEPASVASHFGLHDPGWRPGNY